MEKIVTKKTSKKEFDDMLKSKKRKLNLKQFSGILENKIDGLDFQKKIRNEWK